MKFVTVIVELFDSNVAPLVGAWIEMLIMLLRKLYAKSLPSWERGLKLRTCVCCYTSSPSLPSWERGLKSVLSPSVQGLLSSLPSWERGLKCPFGEWLGSLLHVAPLVGAWIEIPHPRSRFIPVESLPSWERGLKYIPMCGYFLIAGCRSPRGSVD